jgi:outer membrane receptor protein involved in Fe transport
VSLNISNLFNKAPPPASSSNSTAPGQQTAFVTYDDPLGRAYTIGLRARF